MTLNDLNQELNRIKKIIPQLKRYGGQKISVLPKDIRNNIIQIQMLPQMTSAGLESINTVIDKLYLAKYAVEDVIKENTQPVVAKSPSSAPTYAKDSVDKKATEDKQNENKAQKENKPQPKQTPKIESSWQTGPQPKSLVAKTPSSAPTCAKASVDKKATEDKQNEDKPQKENI